MSEPNPEDKPQIEIVSDEDWKSRVKAEDAQRDAERAQPSSSDKDEPFDAAAVPSASLAILVQMLSTQAIVSMGLIPLPDGKTVQQIPLARHFIDLLAVLEEKCRGNLSADESRLLDNTLHELRMAFIEVSRQNPGG